MSDEFSALVRQGTWDLVPPNSNQHLIGCKWVFRLKRAKDGSIEWYKARLVAKGFHQWPSYDYFNTFGQVIKPTTIRIVLSLVVSKRWPICQLDVNNAFLHDAKPVSTPLALHLDLHSTSDNALSDGSHYRQLIGALQYLSLTWPDLSFAINWAADRSTMISTTGYLVFLGQNPISWRAAKQKAIAHSSTEAEYQALAVATSELVWIKNLLVELGVPCPQSLALFCDNVGATYLSLNPVLHSRMKHIAIDLHFVHDLVDKGVFHVSHISSQDQLADGLTKPLSSSRFTHLRSKIDVADGTTILRGRVKETESIGVIT
ncbi:hypothetical protein SLEP1_g27621 [Rubroshorea leprosula]|uniref:Reverse transcriptase Ty1/copia-type domain-containing protein n=1 Tax=Rubroshorea leprosula TaxID=152421 RepID=A0AAV5JX23_9ROSI|nr:hypothetical protein SLEP1_g27621 [Rubroshorea leprosula]